MPKEPRLNEIAETPPGRAAILKGSEGWDRSPRLLTSALQWAALRTGAI
jgi:hypothetical protein